MKSYSPSFKFCRKLKDLRLIHLEKVAYSSKLIRKIRAGRQIIAYDETSTHCWEKLKRIYMHRDRPVKLPLKKERGHSVTLLGAISNRWDDCKYLLGDKTSSANVLRWLEYIRPHISPDGAVVILDNHRSHKTKAVLQLAYDLKLELFFIPPTCS